MRRVHRRATAVLAAAAAAALVPLTPALAAASPSASANVVTLGSAPVLPYGAHAEGATPLDQSLSFDVVLKPRDQAALDSFVQDVSTPGSPQYRHFLAPGEYATTFGPTPQAIASVKSSLAALGLKVNEVTGSVVSVSGSVAQVGAALHTNFTQYQLSSGRIARANTTAPQMPASVAPLVQSVVGLDDLVQFHHPAPKMSRAVAATDGLKPNAVGPQPCFAPGTGYYGADQLASYYGLDSYYAANHLGSGITVALFELERYSIGDINDYQSCYGTGTSVSNVYVDGGPPAGAGVEATLDIEDVVGLAPATTIKVYEAPNSAQGVLDEYSRIATDNTAQVVSTSWGSCELSSGFDNAKAERTIFQQMAAQGQTVFAASGDAGSSACDLWPAPNPAPNTSTALSVSDPASQPEVTAVGGTNLTTATGPETAWNEGVVQNPDSTYSVSAGGGGQSTFWHMPAWQAAAGVLADSSGSWCGAPVGSYCREVPDVSASADPANAYVIIYGGFFGFIGGTSAAAPTWASLLALVDESCPGNRLGLINPALYQLEAADGAAFHDVTTGTNDGAGANSGEYAAAAGYDMATGLGTPVGATLGAGLCPTPALAGQGTMTVDKTTVQASTSTTLTFTYALPANKGIADGEIDVAVPSGWSVPSLSATAGGYTTASVGQVSVSASTIKVKGVTAISGTSITIVYGDASAGGPGATAPITPGPSTFTTSVKTTATGALANIATSPQVQVWAMATDGSGTMTVSPSRVHTSSTATLAFTYTPQTDTKLSNGEIDVDLTQAVTDGWTAPSTIAGAAGLVTASRGTASVAGSTIKVTGVTLDPGDTLTITYGSTSGGAPGATAPATPVTSTLATQQEGTAPGGTLKPLTAGSPSIEVLGDAADGAGTLTLAPSRVSPGSNATLTFTYKAPANGFVTNGEITIDVPNDWSTPSTTGADAGYTTATGATVAVPGDGQEIDVTGINLSPNATLAIVYGSTASGGPGAAVPATDTTGTFPTKEMSRVGGALTAFTPDPSISITNPPPPAGGGGGPIGGHPDLVRVSGADRVATSIAASNAAFPKANSARVVVLARSDSFVDALAGTPLAASQGGPLLLTPTAALTTATIGEISRVLPLGSTIYLLGGTSAIGPAVATTLSSDGYMIARLAGADRYATAVAVAGALGNPGTVFEADGTNFPDALSAGTAAAQQGALVLLTAGSKLPSATAGYLTAHPSVRYAVGGPAAKADPGAVPLVGLDRYATSVLVAQKFFSAPLSVGVASGVNFPDALSGGAVAGLNGGPMVLVPNAGTVSASTTNYLRTAGATASNAWLFGGTASINDGVFTQVASTLKAPSP